MKLICIGRNYAEHIEELDNERPKNPVVFIKPDSAILQNGLDFFIPDFSKKIHYELEVIIKIKKLGKHIHERFAHKYYDEISLGIDFTARDLQATLKKKGLPWEISKGFDGSAVLGRWLPKTNFDSLDQLSFTLEKNGQTVQRGQSKMMLWKIDQLIAYVSRYFTLKMGDVIFTGTPAGVGEVKPGDKLFGKLEDKTLLSINIK